VTTRHDISCKTCKENLRIIKHFLPAVIVDSAYQCV